MNHSELCDALSSLALARAIAAKAAEQCKAQQEAVDALAEVRALASCRAWHTEQAAKVTELEMAIREAAFHDFIATRNKQPAEGLQIKMYHVARFEVSAAREWCFGHAPVYLKLDAARFEKAGEVLAGQGAPVIVVEDPRVVIASDLRGYLVRTAVEEVML